MHDSSEERDALGWLSTADPDADLPAPAYHSTEFHVAEAAGVFGRQWICAGHVAMLPNVGDYFTIDLVGNLLVAVRGKDRIRVLSRTCRHRWASVVEGAGNTRRFTCPFHNWSYGLDGSLLAAAFMDQAGGFDRSECRLPEVRTEILDETGLIFIALSEEAGHRTDLPDAILASCLGEAVAAAPFGEKWIDRNWKTVIEDHLADPSATAMLPNLLVRFERDAATLHILYPNGPSRTLVRSVTLLGTSAFTEGAVPTQLSLGRYLRDCLSGGS